MSFTAAELDRATEVVRRFMQPTPQYRWPLLEAEVPEAAEVWVKHENHTPTGAFKIRGGLVYMERLRRERPHVRGVISATRGNHGQSLAVAGRAAGLDVTIVVPFGNSPDKNAAMVGFGAELIEHGADYQVALEHSRVLAAERGLEPVGPFHDELVQGVATYAKELFDEAGELDVVYVPIGMGSGMCGLIGVRDLLGLRTELVGVVAEQAPAMALSFAAGAPVSTATATTFIDGVACRVPDATAVATINKGAARVVQVSEDGCAEAIRVLLRTTHNMVEPSGATAFAGLLAERAIDPDVVAGKRVGVIMSGGNLDGRLLPDLLDGRTPAP